jgi:Fic family protein
MALGTAYILIFNKLALARNQMMIPESPPLWKDKLEALSKTEDPKMLTDWLRLLVNPGVKPCDHSGRYLHWEKLKHICPPKGYDSELYWLATKSAREKIAKTLPFKDKAGIPFTYSQIGPVIKDMLWISEQSKGAVAADHKITDPKTKDTYLISSLIDESINSSQLEGASTTRPAAKEMIRSARAPQDKSEQMIFNNYRAMLFIREHLEDDLTPSMIFELHKIVTEGTFDAGEEHRAGRFREQEDDIAVCDDTTGEILHSPPTVDTLPARLETVCNFANSKTDAEDDFIPPVIRAIVLHFMIGYDHPFYDGNGRTARALFYWMMAKSGFWLMGFVSISGVIKKAQPSYIKAYLHTETDGGDVTYFIIHQLDVITKAIKGLHKHLEAKSRELRETENALKDSPLAGKLNHRQLAILKNAMENPGAEYTFKSHRTSHGVVNQTARTDLLVLSDKYGLLRKVKEGRTDIFVAPADMPERIKKYGK